MHLRIMALRARTRRRQEVGKELFLIGSQPVRIGKIGILERSRGTERHTRIGIVRQLQRRPPAVVPEHPFAQPAGEKPFSSGAANKTRKSPAVPPSPPPAVKDRRLFPIPLPVLAHERFLGKRHRRDDAHTVGIRTEVAFPFRFFDILINRVHTR